MPVSLNVFIPFPLVWQWQLFLVSIFVIAGENFLRGAVFRSQASFIHQPLEGNDMYSYIILHTGPGDENSLHFNIIVNWTM